MTRIAAFSTDEQRWTALAKRDRQADGAFLYGVRTTGIYCRPGCPSRLPKRANVEFFDDHRQARKRGFRACKKCKPDDPSSTQIPNTVIAACRLIEQSDDPPSLTQLADAVGLSPSHFHRLFRKHVGITPKAYVTARRAERFRAGLRRGENVTEAMYGAGYGAASRCYEDVGRKLGMTPTQYGGGGIGQAIRVAVVPCSLGWVAVAATERGICSIEIGNDPDILRSETTTRFPAATLHENEPIFTGWVNQVVDHLQAPGNGLDLPLDIQGTAFQQKVWAALSTIPIGATSTYTEIAHQIGQPTAVRAVARACAANRIAVVIPCHRVVRTDGSLSGYRWGVERKRKLLEREALSNQDEP